MDTDKEPKSEEASSAEEADAVMIASESSSGHHSGFFGRIKHRIEKYTDSRDPKYRSDSKRRLARKVWRFLKFQANDARQAYRDLQARVNKEVSSSESSRSRRPQMGEPLKNREGKPGTLSVRPKGMPEMGSSKSGGGSKMRRVLVVGGMGFFGAALVRQLNKRGISDIVIADGLDEGQWKNLPSLRFEEFLSLSELPRSHAFRAQTQGNFSHVFYLGGWDDSDTPLALPKSLLGMISEHGGKLICLSSACSLGPDPDPKDIRNGRAESFLPETRAGVMACLFDRYALARITPRGYLSLKHHRLYGPGELTDGSIYGLARSVFQQVTNKEPVKMPKALRPGTPEGDRKHDFLSVSSAAQIAIHLAESDDASGLYELGSGTGHTADEFVRAVFAAMGRKPEIEWEDVKFSAPSAQPKVADTSRLREAGWSREESSLEEGIRRYVQECLQTGRSFGGEQEVETEAANVEKSGASQGTSTPRIFPSRKKPFSAKTAA